MSLRIRRYIIDDIKDIEESTLSGAIPNIIKPFHVVRKERPNLINNFLDKINNKLKKRRKRLIKKISKLSPPLPPRL